MRQCRFSKLAVILAFGLLGQWIAGVGAISRAHSDPLGGLHVWKQLYAIEGQAFRDYQRHVTTGPVLRHASALFSLSQSSRSDEKVQASQVDAQECRQAARTLGYMVQGYVESSRRLEVATDWSHFADRYWDARAQCLSRLDLDAADYPAPSGLGR